MTENQPAPPMTIRFVETADGELVGLVSDEDFAALSAPASPVSPAADTEEGA